MLLWGALLGVAPAHAHLMAAQKGTLNIVGNGAFLVLSVPVSALVGVDDDGDTALSKSELAAHDESIRAQVKNGVQLLGPDGPFPLQVMMLDIAPAENKPAVPASHLVVLGRYELGSAIDKSVKPNASFYDDLSLRFYLFGTKAGEQVQDLTVTRLKETQWLRLTKEPSTKVLFPGAMAVFGEYVRAGATHVLSGADHVLFLLVVLSAGWRWRGLVIALTCFTVGHALTLLACVWGGWSVPDRIVEPAIAATIIGMATFDLWSMRRVRPVMLSLRVLLIFGCAIIHGLGLAGALSDLTQWPPGSMQLSFALAGFNVGIEAAQIGVALLATLLLVFLKHIGVIEQRRVTQFGSFVGIVVGTFWLIERVFQVN